MAIPKRYLRCGISLLALCCATYTVLVYSSSRSGENFGHKVRLSARAAIYENPEDSIAQQRKMHEQSMNAMETLSDRMKDIVLEYQKTRAGKRLRSQRPNDKYGSVVQSETVVGKLDTEKTGLIEYDKNFHDKLKSGSLNGSLDHPEYVDGRRRPGDLSPIAYKNLFGNGHFNDGNSQAGQNYMYRFRQIHDNADRIKVSDLNPVLDLNENYVKGHRTGNVVFKQSPRTKGRNLTANDVQKSRFGDQTEQNQTGNMGVEVLPVDKKRQMKRGKIYVPTEVNKFKAEDSNVNESDKESKRVETRNDVKRKGIFPGIAEHSNKLHHNLSPESLKTAMISRVMNKTGPDLKGNAPLNKEGRYEMEHFPVKRGKRNDAKYSIFSGNDQEVDGANVTKIKDPPKNSSPNKRKNTASHTIEKNNFNSVGNQELFNQNKRHYHPNKTFVAVNLNIVTLSDGSEKGNKQKVLRGSLHNKKTIPYQMHNMSSNQRSKLAANEVSPILGRSTNLKADEKIPAYQLETKPGVKVHKASVMDRDVEISAEPLTNMNKALDDVFPMLNDTIRKQLVSSGFGLESSPFKKGSKVLNENGVLYLPRKVDKEYRYFSEYEPYVPFDEGTFYGAKGKPDHPETNPKIILWWGSNPQRFGKNEKQPLKACPHFPCVMTTDIRLKKRSSAMVVDANWLPNRPPGIIRDDQVMVLYAPEPPNIHHHLQLQTADWTEVFNWTMSYQLNSDIFIPHAIVRKRTTPIERDYDAILRRKRGFIALITNECQTRSRREDYIRSLQKRLLNKKIDNHGACGTRTCSYRSCFDRISSRYKFFLAFESSLCQDYISEDFFLYLLSDTVVVARGTDDYFKTVPSNLFINTADFPTIEKLAERLDSLDADKEAYIEILKEKDKYFTVYENIPQLRNQMLYDSVPFCQLCYRIWNMEKYAQDNVGLDESLLECRGPEDIVKGETYEELLKQHNQNDRERGFFKGDPRKVVELRENLPHNLKRFKVKAKGRFQNNSRKTLAKDYISVRLP